MQNELKKTIENHPVVVYVGAVILGILCYEGALRVLGRATVSSADFDKISRYDALQTEVASLKKGTGPNLLKVELDSLTATPNKECSAPEYPIQVVEKYRLDSEGAPASFLSIGSERASYREIRKADETTIFRVDPARRGWIVSYCIGAGKETEGTRRFLDLDTGRTSAAIPVKVKT